MIMTDLYLIAARSSRKRKDFVLEKLTLKPAQGFYLLPFLAPFPRIGILKSRRSKSGKVRSRWIHSLPFEVLTKLEDLGYEIVKPEGIVEFGSDEFRELIGYVKLRRKKFSKRRRK